MPNVVVAGGVIECSHSGQIQFSSGSSQLEVSGSQAITFGMEAGLVFAVGSPGVVAPCTAVLPNGNPSPCTSSPAQAGVSTLLLIGGVGALLDNATGLTVNPAGPGTWSIASAGQSLLEVDE